MVVDLNAHLVVTVVIAELIVSANCAAEYLMRDIHFLRLYNYMDIRSERSEKPLIKIMNKFSW